MCVQGSQKYCVCTDVRGACVHMYEVRVCEVHVRGVGAGSAADPQAAGRAGVLHSGARLTSQGTMLSGLREDPGAPGGGGRSLPGHPGRVVGVRHRPEVLPDSSVEGRILGG